MRLKLVKCNIMQLTKRLTNKIQASYTLEGTVLENLKIIKYLGVTITHDLKWNTHTSKSCTEVKKTFFILEANSILLPTDVKEAAYTGLMRPVLEYGRV